MIDATNFTIATNSSRNCDNTLLNAALPMMGIVTKLIKLPVVPDSLQLKQLLVHHMQLFIERVGCCAAYDESTIATVRYIMCAFVDDVLLDATWETPLTAWGEDGLSQHFIGSAPDGKKFFAILKHVYEEDHQDNVNIDLLEILYTCLSLGFLGKYRTAKKGGQIIKEIKNKLYEHIVQYRKTIAGCQKLSVTVAPVLPEKNFGNVEQAATKIFSRQIWAVLGLIVLSGVVVYAALSLRLAYLMRAVLT